MLKAPAQGRRAGTKARIVDAALTTLREEGFARASARAIARRGRFNQALVFYHFGSVNDLLLAALDESSARRMASYRAALEESAPSDLVGTALRLYREDLASGHITVVTEMIGAGLANPLLKDAIAQRVEQWVDLAQQAVDSALGGSPLASIMPARDLAYAIVALYLGVEMLAQLHDDERVDALFATAQRVGALVSVLMGPSS
jgi:AcrR family transcriptional regulator